MTKLAASWIKIVNIRFVRRAPKPNNPFKNLTPSIEDLGNQGHVCTFSCQTVEKHSHFEETKNATIGRRLAGWKMLNKKMLAEKVFYTFPTTALTRFWIENGQLKQILSGIPSQRSYLIDFGGSDLL